MSANPYLGEISMFGGNFAPRGWALCNGQLLPISGNSALFSLIGTTYGGDGRTTFALPDLRGRAPIHVGRGPGLSSRTWGQRLGVENVTLNSLQIPSHNHTATSSGGGGTPASIELSQDEATRQIPQAGDVPAKAVMVDGVFKKEVRAFGSANNTVDGQALPAGGGTITISNTGGSQSHTNMPPSLAINYIISLQGIYPSRN